MITEEQARNGGTFRVNAIYPGQGLQGVEVTIIRVFGDPPPHAPAVQAWCDVHGDSFVLELDELDVVEDPSPA